VGVVFFYLNYKYKYLNFKYKYKLHKAAIFYVIIPEELKDSDTF